MSAPIRVLIVDDALVRAGLSMILGGSEDVRVVGEAADGDQVIAAVDAHAELYMSVATVKAHVSHLLTKLKLNNRVQIALLANDAGLT